MAISLYKFKTCFTYIESFDIKYELLSIVKSIKGLKFDITHVTSNILLFVIVGYLLFG